MQIWIGVHHIAKDYKQEVTVHIPLVDFVDDDMRDAPQAGFKLAQQHSNCAKENAAVGSWEDRLKANGVADGFTQLLAAFTGHSLRY